MPGGTDSRTVHDTCTCYRDGSGGVQEDIGSDLDKQHVFA